MPDDSGMRERADRSAQMLRHGRMPHGEAVHVELVDQPAGPETRRRDGSRRQALHHRPGHQRRGIAALPAPHRKPGIVGIWPVDLQRIGIDQQFVGIEPQAVFGVMGSVGTDAVARADAKAGHEQREQAVFAARQLQPVGFAVGLVKDRDPYAFGGTRPDGKTDAVGSDKCSELKAHEAAVVADLPPCGGDRPASARIT